MKTRRFLMMLLALMLVLATPIYAANTPENVLTNATINISKFLKPSDGNVYPDLDTFNFELKPVSYTLAENGVTVEDATATYMPAGDNNISVTVTENAAKTQKEGTTTKVLDFSGKKIGVYTYTLQETPVVGYEGVEYDKTLYYVNIYVINQVDENNVPTGAVTISDITAWKGTNMSAEALKALTSDATGLIGATETDGKVGRSEAETPATISYPFNNSYKTQADISLTKVVNGNYANKEQVFDYEVTVMDNLEIAGTYAVEYYDATGAKVATLRENPATVTSGTIATIGLKHGEKFIVKDLPSSATYNIKEKQQATYSGKYVADGKEATKPTTAEGEANIGADLVATGKLSDNGMTKGVLANEEIVFTNTKNYTVPTGIILNVLPFVVGIAIVAVVLTITNRKKEEN